MNKEIIEKVLLEISTPTGLTYSGDTTICNDEVKDIMNYINNLEQQCKKQKEVIDKATNIINDYLKEDYSIYTENEIEVDLIVKLKNILKEASK